MYAIFYVFLNILSLHQSLRVERWIAPLSEQCLGFDKKDEDIFPIPVDKLVNQTKGQNCIESDYKCIYGRKEEYFKKIEALGIQRDLNVVGPRLNVTCLKAGTTKDVFIAFVGDSVMTETFEAFQKDEQMRQLHTRHVTTAKVPWRSQTSDHLLGSLNHKLDRFNPKTQQLIFYMGTSLHHISRTHMGMGLTRVPSEWQADGWKNLSSPWVTNREQTLKEFLLAMKQKFPEAVVIWDTPPFVDLPITEADPPKPQVWIRGMNGLQLLNEFADIDEKVCKEMGVPFSQRYRLGRVYRGLQCDGIHHHGAYGSPGYMKFHELVIQSALMSLCHSSTNFCKNLDHDYI